MSYITIENGLLYLKKPEWYKHLNGELLLTTLIFLSLYFKSITLLKCYLHELVETFQYKGNSKSVYHLLESKDLIIIRTTQSFDPELLLSFHLEKIDESRVRLLDAYPECSVYVYKILSTNPSRTRTILKKEINSLQDSRIVFIGSVFQNEFGVYQIYTGNIFLKFENDIPKKRQEEIIEEEGLLVKMKLNFAQCACSVEHKTNLGRNIFKFCNQLLERSEVEFCHPEMVVKRKSIDFQKETSDSDGDNSWAMQMVNLLEAWKYTKGEGIKICIIDDGIDLDHPAFTSPNKVIKTIDFFGSEEETATHKFDSEMHGTACASIASSNDPLAFGIAPGTQLLVARTKGLGSVLESEAISWAVDQGADIISCSWGPADGKIENLLDDNIEHPLPDHTRLALGYAAQKGRNGKGCLIFFAAGNGKEMVGNDGYASNPNVMAIGSVNKEGKLTNYSDRGYPLFCCFPSSEILISKGKIIHQYGLLTADRLGEPGYSETDYFSTFGGTSASCPGMAGIAALMLSLYPELSLAQAKILLRKSCVYPGGERIDGQGIVDALQLIKNTLNYKNAKSRIMKNAINAKYRALHIALNYVDSNIYGSSLSLQGCINDARFYASQCVGFDQNKTLENEASTRDRVIKEIRYLAQESESGDYVFITYAGHGSQVADYSGDEINDRSDETLVLYDGLLIDDEVNNMLAEFDKGVNVIWISDSCHSGTNSRYLGDPEAKENDNKSIRFVSSGIAQKVFDQKKTYYLKALGKLPQTTDRNSNGQIKCKANLLTIAACEDYQYAGDLPNNGLFTGTIRNLVEQNGNRTYDDLIKEAKKILPNDKSPKLLIRGKHTHQLHKSIFFKPESNASGKKPNEDNLSAENNFTPPQFFHDTEKLIVDTGNNKSFLKVYPSGNRSGRMSQKLFITQNTISRRGRAGTNPWDSAYTTFKEVADDKEVNFIEPDLISALNGDPQVEQNRSGDYIATYPNPEAEGNEQPLIWHLDDEHSQLRSAFEIATRNEEAQGGLTQYTKDSFPLIAHIDTGILPYHPSTPENYREELSEGFANPIDKDKIFGFLQFEQQGHGQGTITLLAGGKLNKSETKSDYNGYLGAFPYARVVTLRISETVALLSGRRFAKALRYAVDVLKADVVTMSMAGAPSLRMQKAVSYAYEKGVVVVSAGGNCGTKGVYKLLPKTLMYPARYKRVLGVTGATYNDKPYIVKENTDADRAEGGMYMETCYGPEEEMDTIMAAYTPNIFWANKDRSNGLFVKTGGGTSSATPQVAAAAALWLHHHKILLQAVPPGEEWRRVEAVRKALFQSAKRTHNKHMAVFGNGILRAMDALEVEPNEKYLRSLVKTEENKPKGWIEGLIKMYNGRSLDSRNDKLIEMVDAEIGQLIMTQPEFESFRSDSSDERELKIALFTSKHSSQYLKQLLSIDEELIEWQQENANDRSVAVPIFSTLLKLDTDQKELDRFIVTSKTNPFKTTLKKEGRNIDDQCLGQLHIEVDNVNSRSSSTDLAVLLPENEDLSYLVCEEGEDGQKYFSWQFPGLEKPNSPNRVRSLRGNTWSLELNYSTGRGLFKRIKKIIVNVIRVVKDKAPSKLQGLIYCDISNGKKVWKKMTKAIAGKINVQEKTIYFSHGTFSSTEFNFRELLKDNGFLKEVQNMGYGTILVGYNMSTMKTGIKENIDEINEEFEDNRLEKNGFAVIAHSRGCLVARGLFNTQTTRMILCGGPHLGTPIADKDRVLNLIDTLTNLAISATRGTLPIMIPIIKIIPYILKRLAKKTLSYDGISDMGENSEVIQELNSQKPLSNLQTLIATNFTISGGLNFTIDHTNDQQIFDNEMNDLVIPYDSAIALDHGTPSRIISYKNSTAHHLNHFANPKIKRDIKWELSIKVNQNGQAVS